MTPTGPMFTLCPGSSESSAARGAAGNRWMDVGGGEDAGRSFLLLEAQARPRWKLQRVHARVKYATSGLCFQTQIKAKRRFDLNVFDVLCHLNLLKQVYIRRFNYVSPVEKG